MEIETNYQCLSLCPVVSRRGIPRVPTPQSAGRGNNGRICAISPVSTRFSPAWLCLEMRQIFQFNVEHVERTPHNSRKINNFHNFLPFFPLFPHFIFPCFHCKRARTRVYPFFFPFFPRGWHVCVIISRQNQFLNFGCDLVLFDGLVVDQIVRG